MMGGIGILCIAVGGIAESLKDQLRNFEMQTSFNTA